MSSCSVVEWRDSPSPFACPAAAVDSLSASSPRAPWLNEQLHGHKVALLQSSVETKTQPTSIWLTPWPLALDCVMLMPCGSSLTKDHCACKNSLP